MFRLNILGAQCLTTVDAKNVWECCAVDPLEYYGQNLLDASKLYFVACAESW